MYRRDPSGDDQSRPPAVTTDSTPGDIRPAGDLGALRRKRRRGQSKQHHIHPLKFSLRIFSSLRGGRFGT